MDVIEAAILRTVLYADVFNFPLTSAEIHHFLMHHEPLEYKEVVFALQNSPFLRTVLAHEREYFFRASRPELLALRLERESASAKLWPKAQHYATWLARLPFVRMVALTGALAMHNVSGDDDDLDYLVITMKGRVWLARAFMIMLVRFARLRGVEICPNYVLAENKLEQTHRDIFMAHEVTQMVPFFGQKLYQQFRACNMWSASFLPNASGAFHAEEERIIGFGWKIIKNILEFVFTGPLGNLLENWEYHRKLRRFAPDMQKPHSAAQITKEQVKGHFDDNGHPTLQKYQALLCQYGLDILAA